MFDLTISLGSLLTIAGFAITAIISVLSIKGSNELVAQKLDMTAIANDRRFLELDAQVEDFKVEMKKLGDVLIELTRAQGRQQVADERSLAQGKRIDVLETDIRSVLRERAGLGVGK